MTGPLQLGPVLADLSRSLGFERYFVADARSGGYLAGVYHDGPPELGAAIDDMERLSTDPIITLAMATRIPFAWGAGERLRGPLLGVDAPGWQAGLAVSNWTGDGLGAVLLLSGSRAPSDDPMTHAYVALTATNLLPVFERFRADDAARPPLAPRELDCLLYVLAGFSTKETSRALGIGARTVGQYLERARAKLHAQSSLGAATIAVRRGWIDLQRAADLADSASPGARKA